MKCPHCSTETLKGAFCGHCGAHMSAEKGRRRAFAFAAAPGEHLSHISLLSTLFPHLPRRHAHRFRHALLAGGLAVALLIIFRLYTSATLVAVLVLPMLYLLYLYEVEVYEHEPRFVILATFVSGAVFGVAYQQKVGPFIDTFYPFTSLHAHLIVGVVLPVIAQMLMLAGPLFLLTRKHFNDVLDGLTFGAASALGFTLATTIVRFWPVLIGPLMVTHNSDVEEFIRLGHVGILVAIVNASSTGMITAMLWLRRHGRSRNRHELFGRSLTVAAVVAFTVQIALGIASVLVTELLQLVVVWAVGAVMLLLYVRVVLHHGLLEEAMESGNGASGICSNCHNDVPSAGFCPSCGISRTAGPKVRS